MSGRSRQNAMNLGIENEFSGKFPKTHSTRTPKLTYRIKSNTANQKLRRLVGFAPQNGGREGPATKSVWWWWGGVSKSRCQRASLGKIPASDHPLPRKDPRSFGVRPLVVVVVIPFQVVCVREYRTAVGITFGSNRPGGPAPPPHPRYR